MKPRVTTDEQCVELANWYRQERTMIGKAKELGISISALYDAIARGNQLPTSAERFKTRDYVLVRSDPNNVHIEVVPRESNESESNEH